MENSEIVKQEKDYALDFSCTPPCRMQSVNCEAAKDPLRSVLDRAILKQNHGREVNLN